MNHLYILLLLLLFQGECLIDQYRTINNIDEKFEDDELTDNDNCEEKLDIDNINTIVKFVYEESNNRKKALKTLHRSQRKFQLVFVLLIYLF